MNDLTKFTIITLGLGLSLTSCSKEEDQDHFHPPMVENNVIETPVYNTPTVVSLNDYYSPFANMSLIDEAMDLAIELGVEEVMVGIDDVTIYAVPEVEVPASDATGQRATAYYHHANAHISRSFVDGVDDARLYLPATNRTLEEGTYMVLGADVDAWTIIHEMMHHYRYTNRAEIDGKFGGVNFDFSEPFYGEFGAIVVNGHEWPVTETFEYALGIAVGNNASDLPADVLEYLTNQFGL